MDKSGVGDFKQLIYKRWNEKKEKKGKVLKQSLGSIVGYKLFEPTDSSGCEDSRCRPKLVQKCYPCCTLNQIFHNDNTDVESRHRKQWLSSQPPLSVCFWTQFSDWYFTFALAFEFAFTGERMNKHKWNFSSAYHLDVCLLIFLNACASWQPIYHPYSHPNFIAICAFSFRFHRSMSFLGWLRVRVRVSVYETEEKRTCNAIHFEKEKKIGSVENLKIDLNLYVRNICSYSFNGKRGG